MVDETTNNGTAVRGSQQELIFNNSYDLTFLIGVEGNRYRFITVNNAFLTAAQTTREQVEGKYAEDVIPGTSYPFIHSKYDEAIRLRQTIQWEDTSDYPHGRRTGIISITPIFNEMDVCVTLVGSLHDITERKKVEEALSFQQKQLDLIYNTVSDVIFLISVENDRYRFTSVNNAFVTTTGLPRTMIEGKYADEIIPEKSRAMVFAKYRQAINEKRTIQWEETSEYPAGKKTGIVSITPAFNTKGECTSLVGAVHDITERKKALEEKEWMSYLLNERIKELTTLSKADHVLQDETQSTDELMQRFVNILSPGWQYPGITEACITLNDKKYKTAGYKDAVAAQSAIFNTPDGMNGTIEVIYTEESPSDTDGPFLAEEETLLNMLAEKLRVYFEKKGAMDQLVREKKLSDQVIETLPGLFYMIDKNGRYLRWNKLKETMSGYSHEEMATMNSLDFFEDEDREMIREAILRGFRTGHTEVEANVRTKDDQKLLHFFTGVTIDYDGQPCLMGMGIDITERRKIAEQLLKEKELSESVINSLPGIFYLFDANGNFLRWNKNLLDVTGYSEEELSTINPLQLFDEQEKELMTRKTEEVFAHGNANVEAKLVCKDGRRIPYFFHGVNVMYESKPCVMGVGFDITQRKESERELQEAELKFRTLAEQSQVGIYIAQKGKFAYINPRFAEIFGYEQDELMADADPIKTIISPEDRHITEEHIRARMAGEVKTVHYEVDGRKKDGTKICIEFYGSRTVYKGKPAIIGTMVDITERKQVEEALKKSEANLHTVFDTTDTIYTLLDTNFKVVSFNQQSADFCRNELHAELKVNTNLVHYFKKDRWDTIEENMKRVLRGETVNYESNYVQPDKSFHWYHVRMMPVRDKYNTILGLMIALSGITEKKLLEQQILHQRVEEQKKITRAVLNAQEKERNLIGQELHDNVNQILVGAKMFLGLTSKGEENNEELIKKVTALIDNAVNEIRSLTLDQVTPQKKIDLRDLIQSLVDKLNELGHLKTTFTYAIGKTIITDDLKLNIYRIIQEGINNILRHASARSAAITVKAEKKTLFVSIIDDGKGLDTSKKYKGVGINNILNRVDSYNGRIAIDSGPEKGCRIELAIPL